MRKSYLIILGAALIISVIGVLTIYSSSYQKEGELWKLIYKRQLLWVLMGLVLFFLMAKLNYLHLWDISNVLYIAVLLLLFLVFILGAVRLGAQRWLSFAWFNLQPSEIAKLVIVIFLAKYFSRKSDYDLTLPVTKFGFWRAFVKPFLFTIVPVGLIIEQPDLGSATLVLLIFFALLFIAGVKLRYLYILFFAAICALPVFWHFLRDYQKDRLLVFLNPNADPLGAGYTVIQSKIAIGSGGFFGRGWLAGTQSQLKFLPESHTDFIFATFAEQWGLFGSILLLLLYYILLSQAFQIGLRTHEQFGRLLAFGICAMLSIQIFVNIAMTLGLAPVVGVPLPFLSYGGSSLFMTFISLGILANIDKRQAVF